MNEKKTLRDLFYSALNAVDPFKIVSKNIEFVNNSLGKPSKVVVLGFGKASYKMAQAIEEHLKEIILKGLIIVPKSIETEKLKKIQVLRGSHPLPSLNSVKATEKLIKEVKNTDPSISVICLISGGGSALFASPKNGITLSDKKATSRLLMKAGATIQELNIVRKHISKVKGGQLARILYPRRTIVLLISDVVGDSFQTIASGPTAPDESTFKDAMMILKKYRLAKILPERVYLLLENGIKGKIEETPKKGDKVFRNVKNIIIANNKLALQAAKIEAEKRGFYTKVLPEPITGIARIAGKRLSEHALKFKNELRKKGYKRGCLLSGGETTVNVRGTGKGGRNQELALAFLQHIRGEKGIYMLSAGTDGIDGNTDSAGAFVEPDTFYRALAMNLVHDKYLDNNDSYTFLKKTDSLFITGPTGTNVMDIQIIFVEL